jgi:uncharacterized phage protein (TIGR02218 family)
MALIDSESSRYGGRAIELYHFTADGQSYYRTAHPVAYSFMGNSYLPSPKLSRSQPVRASAGDKPPELEIDIAESDSVVLQNTYSSKPTTFSVRIYRVQPLGSHTWWDGKIQGARHKGDRCTLRCPSVLDDEFQRELPNVRFNAQCQHFLFDSHCRLDPLDFAFATTVATISGTVLTVSGVGGNPDGYFQGGVALSLAGERRLVVSHVGTALSLFTAFRTAPAALEAITLYPGCPRTIDACIDTFNNRVNYGGFSDVPVENLFRRGIVVDA